MGKNRPDSANVRYFRHTDISNIQLNANESALLDQINQKVAGAPSLESIMDFVFQHTEPLIPFDRIGLSFIEENETRVVAHWARARYDRICLEKDYAEDLRGSSLEPIIQEGTLRVIGDLKKYLTEHPHSESTKLVIDEGVLSSMTCPLTVENRHVGLLFYSSQKIGAYTERHAAIQFMIAERLSQAVEKAYRIHLLSNANNAYMEMLGFVSHELKNPIAAILMQAQLLNRGFLGELTKEQRDAMDLMIRNSEHMNDMIQTFLHLSRLEDTRFSLRARADVDFVKDVIDPAIEMAAFSLSNKHIKLVKEYPENPCPAECDPELMQIVVLNLLTNAAKYGTPEGVVKISLAYARSEIKLAVVNEGAGFSEADRHLLFRKFSRLDAAAASKQKGSGIGLYICWRILQSHGGTMDAKSEEGAWAEFSFAFPQPLPNADARRRGDDTDAGHSGTQETS